MNFKNSKQETGDGLDQTVLLCAQNGRLAEVYGAALPSDFSVVKVNPASWIKSETISSIAICIIVGELPKEFWSLLYELHQKTSMTVFMVSQRDKIPGAVSCSNISVVDSLLAPNKTVIKRIVSEIDGAIKRRNS